VHSVFIAIEAFIVEATCLVLLVITVYQLIKQKLKG
jgi:hypothetical protein